MNDEPARALVVGAHPDDCELYAGGTIARWRASGCAVAFLILTDGRLGSPDPDSDADEVAQTRTHEAIAAAHLLGVEEIWFGKHKDGTLARSAAEATLAVARAIRVFRPQVVLGHDPWRPYEMHPDHRAAGFATCDGVIAAREHHGVPGLDLPAHRPDAVLLMGTGAPDVFIDVTATHAIKLEALAVHGSQFAHVPAWRERVAAWNADIGAERGYAKAEAFHRIASSPDP